MRKALLFLALLLLLPAPFPGHLGAVADDIPRMTKEELQPLLGNPDVIVIDVRSGPDWNEAKTRIKGSVREDPGKLAQWIDKYPKDKTIVFY